MSITFDESGMLFGPFEENDVFPIEKALHEEPCGDGVCNVEFVVRIGNSFKDSSLVFVEAKKSIPRESDDFFTEIHVKMVHSLTIWLATVCRRHPRLSSYLPGQLNTLRYTSLPIKLILVIPSAPAGALSSLTDKFRKYFQLDRMLWGIQYEDIWVVNQTRTVRMGLSRE